MMNSSVQLQSHNLSVILIVKPKVDLWFGSRPFQAWYRNSPATLWPKGDIYLHVPREAQRQVLPIQSYVDQKESNNLTPPKKINMSSTNKSQRNWDIQIALKRIWNIVLSSIICKRTQRDNKMKSGIQCTNKIEKFNKDIETIKRQIKSWSWSIQ